MPGAGFIRPVRPEDGRAPEPVILWSARNKWLAGLPDEENREESLQMVSARAYSA